MTANGRFAIGVDSFSYHRYFGETTPWEQPLDTRWTTGDFLRRAAELGVEAVSLQTLYLPELQRPLADLRARLDDAGLGRVLAWGHPDGLQGGANPARVDDLRSVLPKARELGCSILRITCGNYVTYRTPAAERIERLTPLLQSIARDADDFGLTVAVENHADLFMRDLVALVQAIDAPNVGINFDTGNAVRVGDDLLAAAQLAAPYIVMVHLKDLIVQAESRGDPALWWPAAPLGRGDFDLPAFIDILHRQGVSAPLFIEMANMHPNWPDEDAAVAEGVITLRQLLAITGDNLVS